MFFSGEIKPSCDYITSVIYTQDPKNRVKIEINTANSCLRDAGIFLYLQTKFQLKLNKLGHIIYGSLPIKRGYFELR